MADEVVLRILEDDPEGDGGEEEGPSVAAIVAFLTECAGAVEPGADEDEDEYRIFFCFTDVLQGTK